MAFLFVNAPFHLRHTLECGQFFRWSRRNGGYLVHSGDQLFEIQQEGDRLHYAGTTQAFVRRFFSLDHDVEEVERALGGDPRLAEALERYRGLRLLRQDPWECTAAFLISMVSNIPRITRNIADIARACGRPLALEGFRSHAFPRPAEMVDEAHLRRLGLGFRAKYLVAAARLAEGGLLGKVQQSPYMKAKETLMTIPGVAEKVADCILLFAYGRRNAFPVDTWIRKVMTKMFFRGRRTPDRAIRAFAAKRWGDHAGHAQQYLYVWSREAKTFSDRPAPTASPA